MVLKGTPSSATTSSTGHSGGDHRDSGVTNHFNKPHPVNKLYRNFARYGYQPSSYACKSPASGRSFETLSSKLRTNNLRPLGFRNNNRAQIKFWEPLISGGMSSTGTSNRGNKTAYQPQHSGTVEKRGSTGCSPILGSPAIFEHHILSSQKGRLTTTSFPTSTSRWREFIC